MEQWPDHCHHQHRGYRRPDEHYRHLQGSGGIGAGDEPAEQASDEPEKVSYNFTSYSADGETEYGNGTVETTGEKKTFNGVEYTEAEVKTNTEPEWVGRKFYIISTATADGTTKYPLYDAEGQEAGVLVTITPTA